MSTILIHPPDDPSLKQAKAMQFLKNSLAAALVMFGLQFASIYPVMKTDPEPLTAQSPSVLNPTQLTAQIWNPLYGSQPEQMREALKEFLLLKTISLMTAAADSTGGKLPSSVDQISMQCLTYLQIVLVCEEVPDLCA